MTRYIASCSGGKDSIATIILAREHNEPLDIIIFSEVMFNQDISGELPEHIDFIKNKAFPIFEKWGYKTKILRSEKTYIDLFMREPIRGKRAGMGLKVGFPMAGRCQINRDLKIKPIKRFLKKLNTDYIQYIGIAADEPKRLKRLKEPNKISLLAKYGYTEQAAYNLCKQYGLLSPIYTFTRRGGCWFCPNCRDVELRHLREWHSQLWERLLKLEDEPNLIGNIWNNLTKTSLHDKEIQFQLEDRQISLFD